MDINRDVDSAKWTSLLLFLVFSFGISPCFSFPPISPRCYDCYCLVDTGISFSMHSDHKVLYKASTKLCNPMSDAGKAKVQKKINAHLNSRPMHNPIGHLAYTVCQSAQACTKHTLFYTPTYVTRTTKATNIQIAIISIVACHLARKLETDEVT